MREISNIQIENELIYIKDIKAREDVDRVGEDVDRVEKLTKDIAFNIKDYGGVGDGITDNTNAFNEMLKEVENGDKIIFPTGVYKGSFVSNKSLHIDFMGSTLIPIEGMPIIKFEGEDVLTVNVIGSTSYGNNSFNVANAFGIKPEMVGYLVDSTTRPHDNTPGINTELIKVNNVINNKVYVYDMLRSEQISGVTFNGLKTLKNIVVENVIIDCSNVNNSLPIIWYYGCENTITRNVEINKSIGHGVRHEKSYNCYAENIRIIKPKTVGSGEGYGVTSLKSRICSFNNIYGDSTRHTIDISTSYNVYINNINDVNSSSSSITIAHNGFGGNITVENANISTNSYGVVWAMQGVTNKDKHIVRDVVIRNINHVVPTLLPTEQFVSVYLQLDYSNVIIDNINLHFVNLVTPTENSRVVRLLGNNVGPISITNLKANSVGIIVYGQVRDAQPEHLINVSNLSADEVVYGCWFRGYKRVKLDNVDVVKCVNVIKLDFISKYKPHYLELGDNINYGSGMLVDSIGQHVNGLRGRCTKKSDYSTVSLSLSDGDTIEFERIISSGKMLGLVAPVGSNVTLNSSVPIEPPIWIGQEFTVSINSFGSTGGVRGNIIIPSGNTIAGSSNITLEDGKVYTFIGYSGKWTLKE